MRQFSKILSCAGLEAVVAVVYVRYSGLSRATAGLGGRMLSCCSRRAAFLQDLELRESLAVIAVAHVDYSGFVVGGGSWRGDVELLFVACGISPRS